MPKSKLLAFIIGGLFVFFVLPSFMTGIATHNNMTSSRKMSIPGARVTKAGFDAIQNGMTYQQVVKVVGNAGEKTGENQIADIKTESYSWVNPGGSNMMVMLQNDRVVSKNQFGL